MKKLDKYSEKYLSYKAVFVLDFILFCVSAILAILLLGFGSDTAEYRELKFFSLAMMTVIVAAPLSMYVFNGHRIVIRHMSVRDLGVLLFESLMQSTIFFIVLSVSFGLHSGIILLSLADAIFSFIAMVSVRSAMVLAYDLYKGKVREKKALKNALIYGIGPKSVAIVTRLAESSHYNIVGFIVNDRPGARLKLCELPVYQINDEAAFSETVASNYVECVIFATDDDARSQEAKTVRYCLNLGVKALISPSIDEVVDGKVMARRIREVRIEDLLGRTEIKLSMDKIHSSLEGKVVMVTGAAGSIGSELCRQLAGFGVGKLILFDNAETPMHNLRLSLEEQFPGLNFVPVIGDVRQKSRIDFAFRTHCPQVVFHAAAYKHVPLMEENPCEAVLVNLFGSRNVADKCLEYGVEKMVMISTDKAVNPTNIMGCTKRLAEIYVQSLGQAVERGELQGRTKFVTTRFGNVLGSNGSVIPRFREQIEKGGPVTVTDPRITRFFMTIPEACRLVLEAATMDVDNKIVVFDMGQPVKIDDLARKMIKLSGLELGKDIDIKYSGLRPGEKLYEEVLSDLENTLPTSHDRIRIAAVRSYPYSEAEEFADKLEMLSREVKIPEMVYQMKLTVPEFKSKNSSFEAIDHEIEQAKQSK